MAGISEVDERWLYSRRFTRTGTAGKPAGLSGELRYEDAEAPAELEDGTLIIPKSMKYVISMAFEMDAGGIDTYIGGPASAACGEGYSRMAYTSAILSEFIRGLGYRAIPAGNSTGMSIAFAIDAGLGELGRNGLLITPKFGPRVRLAKVFTDMPLVSDSPISFGVDEFCNICGKCAANCPGGAIPTGEKTWEPTYDAVRISSNPGVKKWYVNTPACHQVWAEYGMDCGTCMRVCPFNKPQGWLHEATRALITLGSGAANQAILALDDASGFGAQADPKEFWEDKQDFIHIQNA
jgi:reductive dehalogenase